MWKRLAVFDGVIPDPNATKDDDVATQLKTMQEQMDAMKTSNEDLMKANKGLIKDLQGERSNRQQFQTRFESLSGTVQGIIDKAKDKGGQDGNQNQNQNNNQNQNASGQTVDGLRVEIDGDGNAYVPNSALKGITGQYEEAINGLKAENETLTNAVKELSGSRQVQDAFEQTVNSIVGEKPGYAQAKSRLEHLRGAINQAVLNYQNQTNLEGYFTPAQVLDLLDGDLKDFQNEFTEANPGVDIERIVRGYESQRDLRSTLDHISGLGATNDGQTKEKPDNQSTVGDQFKKVLEKPGTLAQASNQKDSGGKDPWANLTDMSGVDLLDNMTDADAAKLEAALRKQELEE